MKKIKEKKGSHQYKHKEKENFWKNFYQRSSWRAYDLKSKTNLFFIFIDADEEEPEQGFVE